MEVGFNGSCHFFKRSASLQTLQDNFLYFFLSVLISQDDNETLLDRDESVPYRPLYKRQGGDIGEGREGGERGGMMQPALGRLDRTLTETA